MGVELGHEYSATFHGHEPPTIPPASYWMVFLYGDEDRPWDFGAPNLRDASPAVVTLSRGNFTLGIGPTSPQDEKEEMEEEEKEELEEKKATWWEKSLDPGC